MLTNQIRPTTLSAAIVFRVHPFLAKKRRELPFLAIALSFFLCCSADHEQDWQLYVAGLYSALSDDFTHIEYIYTLRLFCSYIFMTRRLGINRGMVGNPPCRSYDYEAQIPYIGKF